MKQFVEKPLVVQDVIRGARAASRHKSVSLSFGLSRRSWCASTTCSTAFSSAATAISKAVQRLRRCSRPECQPRRESGFVSQACAGLSFGSSWCSWCASATSASSSASLRLRRPRRRLWRCSRLVLLGSESRVARSRATSCGARRSARAIWPCCCDSCVPCRTVDPASWPRSWEMD